MLFFGVMYSWLLSQIFSPHSSLFGVDHLIRFLTRTIFLLLRTSFHFRLLVSSSSPLLPSRRSRLLWDANSFLTRPAATRRKSSGISESCVAVTTCERQKKKEDETELRTLDPSKLILTKQVLTPKTTVPWLSVWELSTTGCQHVSTDVYYWSTDS